MRNGDNAMKSHFDECNRMDPNGVDSEMRSCKNEPCFYFDVPVFVRVEENRYMLTSFYWQGAY